ncbi:unnamed protein product, partial [marine sediment metagenome]
TANTSDWEDFDDRDWRGRFVKIVAQWDGGSPDDSGSWNFQNIKHYAVESSALGNLEAQVDWTWFRSYLNSNSAVQVITEINTDVGGASTTLIEFRMNTDGKLQIRVTTKNNDTSVRWHIQAGAQLFAADAITIS